MTTFFQLHLLTSYPPACLNRDDLNRPKSVVMGGVPRLRVASQSLKRAWRTSAVFEVAFKGASNANDKFSLVTAAARETGVRTKLMGVKVFDALNVGKPSSEGEKDWGKKARGWAQRIAGVFGTLKGQNKAKPLNDLEIEQLVHFSPDEVKAINDLVARLTDPDAGKRRSDIEGKDLELLREKHKAIDIALFGRMLAEKPKFNMEAACQVAHAFTVHRAVAEDDFFTAVDDLNKRDEDAGSAHMGEQGFGAGLFYQYVCIDCDLLKDNLRSDRDDHVTELASKTIRALIEAATTVAPTGKQNSFASRAWAYYCLAEKGPRQPRSLSLAFMRPVTEHGEGMLVNAVNALKGMRDSLDKVYFEGKLLDSREFYAALNVKETRGSLNEILNFASSCEKTRQ